MRRSGGFVLANCVLAVVAVLSMTSCSPRQPKTEAAKKAQGIEKKFDRGPVAVTLKLDRSEATIADRLNLVIEAVADENFEVELPQFGEKLEQFGIVDYSTSMPQLIADNKTKLSRSYVLEPFLSGDYTIPPMKIMFWKKGGKEPQKHEIETEAITVKIKSLLPEKTAELKIRDIAPPVELPRTPLKWQWPAAAGLLCVLLAAGAIALWKRSHRQAVEQVVRATAHELAFCELEQLVAEDLLKKGQVKLFYQRISDILRRYIERRFGLRAPEQTTEEFLSELNRGGGLDKEYRPLLQNFMTHCDLVKFAEYQPANKEIQAAFDSSKSFITRTADTPAARTPATGA